MPDAPINEEVEQLQIELVDAYTDGRMPFAAFNRLLTSAVVMCEQPALEAASVYRGREARALARLREAAELCR